MNPQSAATNKPADENTAKNSPKTLEEWFELLAADPDFAHAVWQEHQRRTQLLIDNIQALIQTDYERPEQTEAEVLWQQGNVQLLHYPRAQIHSDAQNPIWLIPSLINRHYILDLTPNTSLVRHLQAQGHDVYLINWGEPSRAEQHFDTGDYVTRYLTVMGEQIKTRHPEAETIAAGHCLGGMLALALAQLYPALVDRLALLATPWDFQTDAAMHAAITPLWQTQMEKYIQNYDFIPGEHIQAMFLLRDPWSVQERLSQFTDIAENPESLERFLALHHWSNDHVALTQPVASDCFINFAAHNHAADKKWRVAGHIVDPKKITQPTLIVSAEFDRIVPPASSTALHNAIPNSTTILTKTGHVGMITSPQAMEQLWQPLSQWCAKKHGSD